MVWASELRKGDRIVVQELDNSHWLAEITSASNGGVSGKCIENDQLVGSVLKIYAFQIIGRVGGPIEKHGGNLIPGDLVYTPHHKSGLQYARITKRDKWGNQSCVRWNEAQNEWTKTPRHFYGDEGLEWLGHESDDGALDRLHTRISQDRMGWQASSGRTAMARVPGEENTYYTRFKERRWQGEDQPPVKFSEPVVWGDDTKPPTLFGSIWRRLFG